MKENRLLAGLRKGEHLSVPQQLLLIIQLSIPAIFANISQVLMEYIDSSMVGQLGANGSAAIGLVASSTWLGGGLILAGSVGFSVQTAQFIGAGNDARARDLLHEGMISCFLWSMVLACIGTAISGPLPRWLGGSAEILSDSTWYFRIFAMSAPIVMMVYFFGAMIQATGNMIFPSVMHVIMCALDVVFNSYWIFPQRRIEIGGAALTVPGQGLGVAGAALGTVSAEVVAGFILMFYVLLRSPVLKRRAGEHHRVMKADIVKAAKIGIPVGLEQSVLSGAQVVSTTIVSPLGTVSIAANSLAVTAEGLCYMPGYGIASAAQTLIGQSIGADRKDLVRRLSWLVTIFGMLVQTGSGILLYVLAPFAMHTLSSDPSVQVLGTQMLRIEAFAEPWFAASIIANGVFRGAGDTLVPTIMSLVSMWVVRLPIAAYLAPRIGLRGVWIAMRTELTFRGIIFLIRLAGKKWMHGSLAKKDGGDVQ